MGILLWIILGALAGWIASIIMRNNAEQGAVGNIIVGIVGAVIGGYAMSVFGQAGVTGFNLYSLVVAVIGSVILLAIVNAFKRAAR